MMPPPSEARRRKDLPANQKVFWNPSKQFFRKDGGSFQFFPQTTWFHQDRLTKRLFQKAIFGNRSSAASTSAEPVLTWNLSQDFPENVDYLAIETSVISGNHCLKSFRTDSGHNSSGRAGPPESEYSGVASEARNGVWTNQSRRISFTELYGGLY